MRQLKCATAFRSSNDMSAIVVAWCAIIRQRGAACRRACQRGAGGAHRPPESAKAIDGEQQNVRATTRTTKTTRNGEAYGLLMQRAHKQMAADPSLSDIGGADILSKAPGSGARSTAT